MAKASKWIHSNQSSDNDHRAERKSTDLDVNECRHCGNNIVLRAELVDGTPVTPEQVAAANVEETGAAFTVNLPLELVDEMMAEEAAAFTAAVAAEQEPVAEIINGKATGRFKVGGRYVAGPAKPKGKTKVTLTVTIEVDRDAYEADYGATASVEEIRLAFKTAAVSAIESDLRNAEIVKWS
jgi:hypothetical protein